MNAPLYRVSPTLLPLLLPMAAIGAQGAAGQGGIQMRAETYTLPNGLRVTLHEDRSLPRVVIDTWYLVGSKDEAPRRTGFAHLFEHLMFMGTERVPGNSFDVIMESRGGSNNASTGNDRTNYFSEGPSSLLPTLLWLDADRLDGLARSMTQEKLDLQREVVRNERRQTSENVPYGKARLILPGLLFPEGHPYHHSVIGSHEDLQAATVEDVVEFFETFYVPANASLVVAGNFDAQEVKAVIERTFGEVTTAPAPGHRSAPSVALGGEVRHVAFDQVQFPKLFLAWHSPPAYRPGDGEMDLIAGILAGGPSTRLERRLVIEKGLAQEVEAYQGSRELGSVFQIEAVASPGVDLETIEGEILAVLDELRRDGPTQSELERVKAATEASFLRRIEGLFARADRMNAYLHHFGVADGFQRDLERWTRPSVDDLRGWARAVFVDGHVDLRILPEGTEIPRSWAPEETSGDGGAIGPQGSLLDERPADFGTVAFLPPVPTGVRLSNGIPVLALPRPGSGLFSGRLVVLGGEGILPGSLAGAASLAARMLESGAGGFDAPTFAQAVESLGATLEAEADRHALRVSVDGLSSKLDETLARFADMVLRPNLTAEDFDRERGLALAAIRSRQDNPRTVASNAARRLVFGEHPSGRPTEGYAETVEALEIGRLRALLPTLAHPEEAAFVFVGDFEVEALQARLEASFGGWKPQGARSAPVAPLVEPPPGRLVLIDRPEAPQTVILLLRPIGPAEGEARAARACIEALFGRTFTSRLNQNLREDKGYTYGAFCRTYQQGGQHLLLATSAVRTEVTGAALSELRREFAAIATGDVTAAELDKGIEVVRGRLVETAETTASLASTYAGLVGTQRPLDSIHRDLDALERIDLDAVNTLARSGLFDWSTLQIVLVGDRGTVVPQILEAGFPEPLLADPEGRLE